MPLTRVGAAMKATAPVQFDGTIAVITATVSSLLKVGPACSVALCFPDISNCRVQVPHTLHISLPNESGFVPYKLAQSKKEPGLYAVAASAKGKAVPCTWSSRQRRIPAVKVAVSFRTESNEEGSERLFGSFALSDVLTAPEINGRRAMTYTVPVGTARLSCLASVTIEALSAETAAGSGAAETELVPWALRATIEVLNADTLLQPVAASEARKTHSASVLPKQTTLRLHSCTAGLPAEFHPDSGYSLQSSSSSPSDSASPETVVLCSGSAAPCAVVGLWQSCSDDDQGSPDTLPSQGPSMLSLFQALQQQGKPFERLIAVCCIPVLSQDVASGALRRRSVVLYGPQGFRYGDAVLHTVSLPLAPMAQPSFIHRKPRQSPADNERFMLQLQSVSVLGPAGSLVPGEKYVAAVIVGAGPGPGGEEEDKEEHTKEEAQSGTGDAAEAQEAGPETQSTGDDGREEGAATGEGEPAGIDVAEASQEGQPDSVPASEDQPQPAGNDDNTEAREVQSEDAASSASRNPTSGGHDLSTDAVPSPQGSERRSSSVKSRLQEALQFADEAIAFVAETDPSPRTPPAFGAAAPRCWTKKGKAEVADTDEAARCTWSAPQEHEGVTPLPLSCPGLRSTATEPYHLRVEVYRAEPQVWAATYSPGHAEPQPLPPPKALIHTCCIGWKALCRAEKDGNGVLQLSGQGDEGWTVSLSAAQQPFSSAGLLHWHVEAGNKAKGMSPAAIAVAAEGSMASSTFSRALAEQGPAAQGAVELPVLCRRSQGVAVIAVPAGAKDAVLGTQKMGFYSCPIPLWQPYSAPCFAIRATLPLTPLTLSEFRLPRPGDSFKPGEVLPTCQLLAESLAARIAWPGAAPPSDLAVTASLHFLPFPLPHASANNTPLPVEQVGSLGDGYVVSSDLASAALAWNTIAALASAARDSPKRLAAYHSGADVLAPPLEVLSGGGPAGTPGDVAAALSALNASQAALDATDVAPLFASDGGADTTSHAGAGPGKVRGSGKGGGKKAPPPPSTGDLPRWWTAAKEELQRLKLDVAAVVTSPTASAAPPAAPPSLMSVVAALEPLYTFRSLRRLAQATCGLLEASESNSVAALCAAPLAKPWPVLLRTPPLSTASQLVALHKLPLSHPHQPWLAAPPDRAGLLIGPVDAPGLSILHCAGPKASGSLLMGLPLISFKEGAAAAALSLPRNLPSAVLLPLAFRLWQSAIPLPLLRRTAPGRRSHREYSDHRLSSLPLCLPPLRQPHLPVLAMQVDRFPLRHPL